MKFIITLFIFLLAGCASIKEEVQVGYDKVSCRIDCRMEGKIPDDNAKTCSCVLSEKKTAEALKIEELSKKLEELNAKVEEQKLMSEPPAPPPSIANPVVEPSSPTSEKKKEKSNDPLRDLLSEE